MDPVLLGLIQKVQNQVNPNYSNYSPLNWAYHNMLPTNVQTGSDFLKSISGYLSSIGTETVTSDPNQGINGTENALKVVTPASANSGVKIANISVLPNKSYTVRTIIKGTGSPPLKLYLYELNSSLGVVGSVDSGNINPGTGFEEIKLTKTFGATGAYLAFCWYVRSATASTFHIGPSILRESVVGVDV